MVFNIREPSGPSPSQKPLNFWRILRDEDYREQA